MPDRVVATNQWIMPRRPTPADNPIRHRAATPERRRGNSVLFMRVFPGRRGATKRCRARWRGILGCCGWRRALYARAADLAEKLERQLERVAAESRIDGFVESDVLLQAEEQG